MLPSYAACQEATLLPRCNCFLKQALPLNYTPFWHVPIIIAFTIASETLVPYSRFTFHLSLSIAQGNLAMPLGGSSTRWIDQLRADDAAASFKEAELRGAGCQPAYN